MRRLFIVLCFFYFGSFIILSAQEEEANSKAIDSVAGIKTGGGDEVSSFNSKGFHFFNIYFKWGSGDFLKPVSQRIIREEFDIKATYLYTFAAVPWLSLGLSSQFKVSPNGHRIIPALEKPHCPTALS